MEASMKSRDYLIAIIGLILFGLLVWAVKP
jgi:hypothetical protein